MDEFLRLNSICSVPMKQEFRLELSAVLAPDHPRQHRRRHINKVPRKFFILLGWSSGVVVMRGDL